MMGGMTEAARALAQMSRIAPSANPVEAAVAVAAAAAAAFAQGVVPSDPAGTAASATVSAPATSSAPGDDVHRFDSNPAFQRFVANVRTRGFFDGMEEGSEGEWAL